MEYSPHDESMISEVSHRDIAPFGAASCPEEMNKAALSDLLKSLSEGHNSRIAENDKLIEKDEVTTENVDIWKLKKKIKKLQK